MLRAGVNCIPSCRRSSQGGEQSSGQSIDGRSQTVDTNIRLGEPQVRVKPTLPCCNDHACPSPCPPPSICPAHGPCRLHRPLAASKSRRSVRWLLRLLQQRSLLLSVRVLRLNLGLLRDRMPVRLRQLLGRRGRPVRWLLRLLLLVVELGVYCVELGPAANSSIHTECVLGATEICVYGLRCTYYIYTIYCYHSTN